MASIQALLASFFLVLAVSATAQPTSSSLRVGFYKYTCPSAEAIVRDTVYKAFSSDPGLAADFVRMIFHDCFVRGCDASILLNSTKGNIAERDSPVNNPSLEGFNVIDQVKAQLEAACPQTVSCADIIAFAARDSIFKAGGIYYDIPSGRRDGLISLASEVTQNLPPPSFTVPQLIANFARKGFSVDEMVTLSGAHSIGVSHCTSFSNRLYSFNATSKQDPLLDPKYAAFLKTKCPQNNSKTNPTVALDSITPNILDNKYYQQLMTYRGLLSSDEALYTSMLTKGMVLNNAKDGSVWGAKFVKAMVKLGSVDVLTGMQGEIRKVCSAVN
ncbi:hypothetical protein NL676_022261 [Syzygium grande]|nr:hypothetical protein NL676_022261 [Syzygium grande]